MRAYASPATSADEQRGRESSFDDQSTSRAISVCPPLLLPPLCEGQISANHFINHDSVRLLCASGPLKQLRAHTRKTSSRTHFSHPPRPARSSAPATASNQLAEM